MKKKTLKYLLCTIILLFGTGLYTLHAGYPTHTIVFPEPDLPEMQIPEDSIPPARYPVAKTVPEEYKDLLHQSPADLRNPDNVKTHVEYDTKTGTYIVRSKLGNMNLGTPISLTPDEYQDYSLQQSINSYYRRKNQEEFEKEADKKFTLADMGFGIGAAERLFGPGGVRIKTQGSAEVTLGMKQNKTKNPTLPERARNRTFFNFDENVQLNVQATVGSKVNFGMNYNTETSFDFDTKKLKLAYTGEEDEIIKSLEAGNVSMTTNNSLINGGAALFGVKADLQFSKLRVNTLFAQQESESKTVNSKGGVQTRPYEITIDQYDENRHFFLSQYFRDNYDKAMSRLPYIDSKVSINRVEVWITNKRSNYDQARNIVAFSDLAEHKHISNPQFQPNSSPEGIPFNEANTLYRTIIDNYPQAREISTVTQTLSGLIEGGKDIEKVESARRLDESEYTINKQLGYISLNAQLQSDEVLAVAFEYQYSANGNAKACQVGEFSNNNNNNTSSCLYVKLLKGSTMSPSMPYWNLMMKNIYSLGAYSVQKEKFRLDILHQSDTTGTYLNYIQEGEIANKTWLKVMNLDRLDSRNEPSANGDGFFDFVPGYTVLPDNGKIIFPVVEPFGAYLKKAIGNEAIARKYVFQELYDSTLTVARQIAEKNKFILRGEYKASSGSEIQLEASNVAPGSVRVTAGGAVLMENVDYTVDYASGTVTILNESILSGSTPVSVSLENRSLFNMQRKTMVGVDLNYQFNKDLTIGGTVMHMSEMPLTVKTAFGDESIKNTLWGLNASYKAESQWLTNLFDKLPLLTLTKASQISFNAEFAHLIAGHYENKNTGGYSYLDDFESTQSGFDLLNPYPWNLASVPYDDSNNPRFPEASLVNNINYGKSRALLAWYYIDGLFTRKNSSIRPKHIDKEQLSNHYIREVLTTELYPQRQNVMNESSTLQVLNLAFYPNERGPYNLDADGTNPDGTLATPEKRWGGIMRKIDQNDFEASNIEYIEFWLLDPFIYNPTTPGGDLYFNLGEISEDILKDEKKFFENGLPIDGDMSKVETTAWGKVPRQQSTVYAFDNTAGARQLQDVGLNGLSSEEEAAFPAYSDYLDKLRNKLLPETLAKMNTDPFSPFNDPAADKYHYFRGSDYDREEADILTRYKRFNGTEGNSAASEDSPERYETSAKTMPDVEDLNQDNTLNENEKYFEYRISVRPTDTVIGTNHIVDRRTSVVSLPNGNKETVNWYQFKIPVKKYDRRIGAIQDFKTIRFMRMYMTGFREKTILRFGSFELVRGEWRTYEQDLSNSQMPPIINGSLEVSSVNIEENSDRKPVNYILPPGISRMQDPGQLQLRQENEQSLSMKVTNLAPLDARAVYKNTMYDMRQYKRLQLFTHAEALEKAATNATDLSNGELSVFIRLGSDYKNNYYEYEVPVSVTPEGDYSMYNSKHQEIVWPSENTMNFRFEVLTNLKLNRNRIKREGNRDITFQSVYSEYDPDNTRNKVSIVGNPSLSEIKTILIGVRNSSKEIRSAEIWVNELRLTDFNEEGGWAANANLNIALSDLGTLNVGGRVETAGFGALDQSLMERRMDDYSQYNIAATVQLGKFFPEKTKVSIPMYYAYSKEAVNPKYNPLDQDIKLSDALDAVDTRDEKDSIRNFSQNRSIIKSISFNNVKVDIKSKNPMPYDPANFSFGYSFSENSKKNPDTEYETTKDYRGNLAYTYTPYVKPFKPFDKLKKNNAYTQYARQLSLNYLPSNISFQTALMRNYYEMQLRDLTTTTGDNNIPVSFSQNFYWDRAFSLRWDFTSNLNMTFTSGTNARIEEPYVQVNRELNPDQYKVWKDSVMQSIADLGTPMKYDQTFAATWNLPLQYIPALNWINASATYNTQYNWDRGARIGDGLEIGNTIRNQRQINIQSSLNMLSFYNKNNFLKKVNQKFSTTTRPVREKKKPVKIEIEIQLNTDSGTIIQHSMLSKKVRITARSADGHVYAIKYRPINTSQVMILNKDTAHLKLTIIPGPLPTENILYKVAEHGSRLLMMVRRINLEYGGSDGMMLPGFSPEIGDIFGQGRSSFGLTPGLGFAFGRVKRDFIDDANGKNWLIADSGNINPAIMTSARNLTIRASLEPVTGLKIDLNANRVDTRNTEIQFMYDGMPEIHGGSFTMTTIALGSALKGSGNAANGYSSESFEKFISNRAIIATRLENRYTGQLYPGNGFLSGSNFEDQPYNPKNGNVKLNSADVLIPAFLAAYTGRDANNVSVTAFPSIRNLLPNWRITYDGLVRIPLVKKHLKNIMLSHQYRCAYSVGAFSTFLNWADAGQDGLGYIRDILTGNPTPSSPYDIASVSITEGFSPLFGVDATLLNNVTIRSDYSTTRNLSLNISSYQLVEALSKKMTIGLGYKFTEFNKILRMKKTRDYSNDLTVRLDFSYNKMQALIRKIEDRFTQATSGNIAKTIQFSADYGLSRALTFRAFYDLQINEPLISSASFPTSNSNYGISLRFSLAQ